jgi:hypothetical protein
MAMAAHHHHAFDQHWKGPIHLFSLWPIGRRLRLYGGADGLARNLDCALNQQHKTHWRLEQGRFARAVHPHKPGDYASGNLKAGVAQGGVTVAIGDGRPGCKWSFRQPFHNGFRGDWEQVKIGGNRAVGFAEAIDISSAAIGRSFQV